MMLSLNTAIFAGAALLILIIGGIAERHIEDESWQRKKRFRQQVRTCYQRQIIRHRTPYAEIGWSPRRW